MKDIVPQLREWQRQGKRYALATLVKVDRSAPKPPGAAMAVCEDGTVAGSVSGGCVESALHEQATNIIETGVPKTVSYGISDAEGWDVGLACGGQLHLFVASAAGRPARGHRKEQAGRRGDGCDWRCRRPAHGGPSR